jgi:uncharacterized membrane protein YhaH (DUF805 family)
MNPFDYFKKCVTTSYADFNGRARRSEYWYFYLFYMIIAVVASFIHETLYLIIALAMIVPSIAAGVRRMHDVGKSGWFLLIPIYNLILAITDSQPGKNEYGPNPKTGEGDELHDHLV